MGHDSYWKETWDKAHERLDKLFIESKMSLEKVVGDDHGIDSVCDAKKVLMFVFDHRPSNEEKACAIVSVMESLMAWHELNEHKESSMPANKHLAGTGVLVK